MSAVLTLAFLLLSPQSGYWPNVYSVLDAGKPGTPHLSAVQRNWLALIRKAPAYAPRWKHLVFRQNDDRRFHVKVPLLVYDPDGWTPAFHGFAIFHVIGAPCNAYYEPAAAKMTAPSSAACDHVPPPVPGEAALLRDR